MKVKTLARKLLIRHLVPVISSNKLDFLDFLSSSTFYDNFNLAKMEETNYFTVDDFISSVYEVIEFFSMVYKVITH